MPPTHESARSPNLILACLGVWTGIVMCSGATAAIAFPAVKALAPSLPGISADIPDHWKIAAGEVANGVFRLALTAEMACAAVAGLTIAWYLRKAPRRMSTLLRVLTVFVPMGLLAYHAAVLSPRMQHNLGQFMEAARAGQVAAAARAQAAFDLDHPTATRVLGLMLGALVVAMIAWVWRRDPAACPADAPGPSTPT